MHQRIAGVVILEADTAKRIAARYFDSGLRTFEQQTKFEKDLVSKATKSSAVFAAAGIGSTSSEKGKESIARRGSSVDAASVQGSETAEIVLIDEFFVVLRVVNDVLIAVTARQDQNDLLISEYASTVVSALNLVTVNTVVKKKLFDRLDQVFLILDESLEEGGMIFELDAHNIHSRIAMNEDAAIATPANGGRPPTISASTAVREGIAAISRGDTDSLRSMFSGAAQTFSNFLGR